MRFRQAMSVLAQAIEAAQSMGSTYSTALCRILARIEDPEGWGLNKSQIDPEINFRHNVAKLCILAGVTREHCKQLEEHIRIEIGDYAYLHDAWAQTGKFGVTRNSHMAKRSAARCKWLRTLGRTAPAKAKEAHAAE